MQGTVKYSREYKLPDGSTCWIGHEMEYDLKSQDPPFAACAQSVYEFACEEIKKVGDIMNINFNHPNFLTQEPLSSIQVEKEPEGERIDLLIGDMLNEKELKAPNGGGLLSWQRLVASTKSEKFKDAYDKKYAELTQKQ